MTWTWNRQPSAPTTLSVQRTATSDRLSWNGARFAAPSYPRTSEGQEPPYLLYNVYASTTPDVDVSEPRNLIATRLKATQLNVPHTNGQTLFYAVCALDRYGNESEPKQSETGVKRVNIRRSMTPNDTRIPPFYYFWSKKQQKKYNKTH